MLLGGWSDPARFIGLLEDLYDDAYESASVNISEYEFKGIAGTEASKLIREMWTGKHGDDAADAEGGWFSSEDDLKVPASAIMMGIVSIAFNVKNMPNTKAGMCGIFFGAFSPIFIRLFFGLPPLASTEWGGIVASLSSNISVLLTCFYLPVAWGNAVQTDNLRRKRAYNILGRMLVEPGVEVKEFLKFVRKNKEAQDDNTATTDPEGDERDLGHVFVDPMNRENVLGE